MLSSRKVIPDTAPEGARRRDFGDLACVLSLGLRQPELLPLCPLDRNVTCKTAPDVTLGRVWSVMLVMMSRASLWGRRQSFCLVRRLSRQAGPEDAAESERSGPIPFSTSKASPRVWSVDRSMGSDYQRSWKKALPVSLLGIGLLLWCVFREETEIDKKLGDVLHEQVLDLVDKTPKSKLLPPPQQEKP
ncbi:ubiquinol-cytochrome c reductase complex assembly factor 4 [Emydura macquarii macquarii]|uniref:ubiquinol-cytochrome c reductase complex assembly factor 4 n=1 Tax=Emydura macquarii macquarii TaxID=1129001 RepID=UPI00352B5C90